MIIQVTDKVEAQFDDESTYITVEIDEFEATHIALNKEQALKLAAAISTFYAVGSEEN